MGLLQKLKSVLGLDGTRGRPGSAEPDVTVEREPSTETEEAVTGGGSAGGESGTSPGDAPRAPRSASSAGSASSHEASESEAADETTGADEAAGPLVEEINGIGPTYAERLDDAGIATVADLAASDAETVAQAAETSAARAEDWIEQATDF